MVAGGGWWWLHSLLSQITNFPGLGRGGGEQVLAAPELLCSHHYPTQHRAEHHSTGTIKPPGSVNRGLAGLSHSQLRVFIFSTRARRLPDMKTLHSFPRDLLSL